MLKIKILSSPDNEILGERSSMKNSITIGHKHGDFLIFDPDIIDNHVTFESGGDALIMHLNRKVDYFHLNGKKTSGIISLKKGDQLKIAATTIEIVDFSHTLKNSRKEQLNTKLAELIEKKDPILNTLKAFENRMEE